MKRTIQIILAAFAFAPAVLFSAPAQSGENPVSQAVPSEQARDLNTFQYESTHDVETTHPNTEPSDNPLPPQKVTQDVLNRFNEVYRQKKILYDQAQQNLAAAQDDIKACDKLSAADQKTCLSDANAHITDLKQSISDLNFDMNDIKRKMNEIQQNQ